MKFLILTQLFTSLTTAASAELKFDKIYFNRDEIELSALTKKGDDLLFVGDKLSNRAIYKVTFEKNRFYYTNYLDLSKLTGHTPYFAKALLLEHAGKIVKNPFDLEGVTYCGDTFYLINEQVRHVLKIKDSTLTNMKVPFEKTFKEVGFPLHKVSRNAGFEGIAADCKNSKLYIAQERSPRGIIKVDIKSGKVEDHFLFSNKETKYGSMDYADLHYENGFLYLLERNEHLITKYDLQKKKIVTSVSFNKLDNIKLRELYDSGEIFGLAEGLTMSKERIFIGVDNNMAPLSKKSQKKYNLKGNFSSIIIYKRPKGF